MPLLLSLFSLFSCCRRFGNSSGIIVIITIIITIIMIHYHNVEIIISSSSGSGSIISVPPLSQGYWVGLFSERWLGCGLRQYMVFLSGR